LQFWKKIQKLQKVLSEKVKRAPDYRFYAIYDKIHCPYVLEYDYRLAKTYAGIPGADGEMGSEGDGEIFEQFEEEGREKWLGSLAKEFWEGTYTPGAVRRIFIEQANGKLRPLGIPNLKDRVVQTAAGLIT
jgi:retron-type reverse transcriptase